MYYGGLLHHFHDQLGQDPAVDVSRMHIHSIGESFFVKHQFPHLSSISLIS
jgi:hypothetical protein